MRKKFFSILLMLCIFASLPLAAFAQQKLDYVTDAALLLSETEKAELENSAKEVSEKYDCGVYIIVVDDYTKYYSSYDVFNAAEGIYTYYGLGHGPEQNGILLLLSMNERDFALAVYGSAAHTAFTDYGKEIVIDSFLPELGNNDWYGRLNTYISSCASLLQSAAKGNPVDVPEVEATIGEKLLFVLGVPAVIALIVCLIFCAQMKTVRSQNYAGEYIDEKSFDLNIRQDMFLHRSVIRTPIPKPDSNSGHGGGGTTIRSSGFSGRSGKF
ncbi:MAG: TPM domain-containing protein [Oscillospiraceae bacterium]|nr:TPM domain-containing protein [Oscillospiraceae bacterium]